MKTLLKILALISIALYFTACASGSSDPKFSDGLLKINKQASFITGAAGELAPILFKGEVYFLSFGRASVSVQGGYVQVQRYPSLEIIATHPLPYAYGSAIVVNDVVHIFASSESNPGNSIITASSTDLINWTAPQVIFTAPANQTIYNTSPTVTDDGYAISYEVHEEGNRSWFYQRFLHSADLATWSSFGDKYDRTNEEACPMLRFVNGYYYLFTTHDNSMKTGPRYQTFVTRSKDLVTFEDSPLTVLSSSSRNDEGNNNSDLDAIEVDGKLIIVYGVGDQVTWGAMKSATYDGTLVDFVNEFFPLN